MTDSPDPSGTPERARPGSWPTVWVRAIAGLTSVSQTRREQVLRETWEGSQPTALYYVLLGLSELIAGFALMINSDATLIGANVVAPLMTPIFGISLGLMRGDMKLLRSALLAEFGGAALGALLCLGLGLLPFGIEPSAALLAQTKPTLIDLLIATMAGLAGGLAMIDERVSPALPGVAIATALNPPIAAIGLCLAYGAYDGAWGAFILFFANVLAILAVAAGLFLAAGFVTKSEFGSVRGLIRRFAVAGIGLVAVTFLLTGYLEGMVRDLRTNQAIDAVLDSTLSREPGTALVNVETTRNKGGMDVLATVRTPRPLSPQRVKVIQDALAEKLAMPVQLFMRCGLTKDITATGSLVLRPYASLTGKGLVNEMSPQTQLLQEAEQIGRETADSRPDIVLKDVELLELPVGPVIIFSVENPRDPSATGVARFQALLRERLQKPNVHVVVRTVDSSDITAKGRILFGEAHFGQFSPEHAQTQANVEKAIREGLEKFADTFVTAVDAVERSGKWLIRAEVVGPKALTPMEVTAAEKSATGAVGFPLTLSVRTRTDLMVTSHGYAPIGGVPILDPVGAAASAPSVVDVVPGLPSKPEDFGAAPNEAPTTQPASE